MTSLAVSPQELLEAFQSVGLERGDVVYVASSLAALGMMDDPVRDTLGALRQVVGEEGTLVMPAFNFDFCRGEPFDVRRTPSTCGQLSETFRTLTGVVRSASPPYHGVTAVGPGAREFGAIRSLTSFGRDSVFQHLHDVEAKHLLIGCGYDEGVAHFHWLEELREVPYRYWKKIEGQVISDGECHQQTHFMYARRLDLGVELDADVLGEEFERAGFVRSTTVGLCRIRAFELRDLQVFAAPRLARDPLVLLKPGSRGPFQHQRTPILGIDHIAVVSKYSDRIREFLRSFFCDLSHEGIVRGLGVRCEYYSGLDAKLEFVDPVAEESCVDGYLRQNPNSPLHHIALEVTALDEAVDFFKSKGYAPLDGRVHDGPQPGQRVMFLSPIMTGGLLVELVCNNGVTGGLPGGAD